MTSVTVTVTKETMRSPFHTGSDQNESALTLTPLFVFR